MDFGISGKSALVLAASKGLGRASALALAAEGVHVMIGSRDAARLEKTAAEIREETGSVVRFMPVDVTNPAQCQAIFAAAGPVDILVNNAGGPPFGPVEQFDDEA